TSAVLRANTTASAGVTGNGDSSRPWCSRTALALVKRTPKRARSDATGASGNGRFSVAGNPRGWFMAFSVDPVDCSPPRKPATAPVRRPGRRDDARYTAAHGTPTFENP